VKKAAKSRKSRKPGAAAKPKVRRPTPGASSPPQVASKPRSSDNVFMHESAFVDEGAKIGGGTKIWHFCHVMRGAVIGDHCNLGQNVVVMSGVRIGNNVKIQNNVSVYEGVEIEDDVFCGPSMVFTNVMNPRSHVSRKNEYRKTLVRRGTTIGANATLVCGVTLGEYSFVGAGAVVTENVAPYALVVGVPARRVGWMCQCGERLPDSGSGTCPVCGSSYERSGEAVRRTNFPTR
jgi:UDP-2-acetamido-3-amino-2,3-dideoxy-glucuronate N-acetyltransferase